MSKKTDKNFVIHYSDNEIKSVKSWSKTVANAIARLFADGRKYTIREV